MLYIFYNAIEQTKHGDVEKLKVLRCQSYILEAKKKREKKKQQQKTQKTTTTTKDFSGIERGAPDSMTNVLTITVQSSWISYFPPSHHGRFYFVHPKSIRAMPVDNANVRLSQWKSTIPVQLQVLDYILPVHCYRILVL